MEQLTQTDLLLDIEAEMKQERASVGQRFVNYLIDFILFYVFVIIVGAILGLTVAVAGGDASDLNLGSNQLLDYLIGYALYVIYYTLLEGATKGKTVGKLLTRTRAKRIDGSELTWNLAFKRSLCRIIPFEPFSGFGTPWHDSIVDTMVVKEN